MPFKVPCKAPFYDASQKGNPDSLYTASSCLVALPRSAYLLHRHCLLVNFGDAEHVATVPLFKGTKRLLELGLPFHVDVVQLLPLPLDGVDVHGFSGVERLHGKDLSAQQSEDKPEYDGLVSRQCADGHFKKQKDQRQLL